MGHVALGEQVVGRGEREVRICFGEGAIGTYGDHVVEELAGFFGEGETGEEVGEAGWDGEGGVAVGGLVFGGHDVDVGGGVRWTED